MTTPPLITTIIPTFQRPAQLKRAIRSALNQTYPHLQVCVYDNASGDETASVVAGLAQEDPRVKYHCHPHNINAAPNFEYGMLQVNTPFFSILSDDDVLIPEFYETALAGFKCYPKAAFSAGAVIDMTDQGEILGISKVPNQQEFRIPPDGMFAMISHYINWTGILFRREVIESIGGIDAEVKPIDLDFVLKAAARFSYVVSPEPYALFIQHPRSYSGNAGLKLVWPSWLKIMENLKKETALTIPEQERAELLMKFQLKKLLTVIAKNDVLKNKTDDLLSIAQLLSSLPGGWLRGRLLAILVTAQKRSKVFTYPLSLCLIYMYKTYKFIKNHQIKKGYFSYAKLIQE